MKINLDVVPKDLNQAVQILIDAVEEIDIKDLNDNEFDTTYMHHGMGRWLRNNWSLWESDTPLVIWFKENLKITHPDDISSIILKAFVAKFKKQPYDLYEDAKRFIDFWQKGNQF